jgi:hypothetical protein
MLLLTSERVVFGWGSNASGQLGLEGLPFANTPTEITSLRGRSIVKVRRRPESKPKFNTETAAPRLPSEPIRQRHIIHNRYLAVEMYLRF